MSSDVLSTMGAGTYIEPNDYWQRLTAAEITRSENLRNEVSSM